LDKPVASIIDGLGQLDLRAFDLHSVPSAARELHGALPPRRSFASIPDWLPVQGSA
jgi:hypothetical protein